ncbi:MAG: IS4 family transposase [bacterium]|nr:IS4 family transposase [bacterium]
METTITLIINLIILLKNLPIVLDARNLWTLAAMIALLMKGKHARLYELARALPCDGKLESRVQKLRRWVSNSAITPIDMLPAFLELLAPVLSQRPEIVLIIDRTSWKRLGRHINLFLCSIAFNGRSFPVFWLLLPTRGCSTLAEQHALLTPVLTALAAHPLLSTLPITVLADREFCSPLLPQWLKKQGIHWAIRVKKSLYVSRSDFPALLISRFLERCQRGEYYLYPNVLLTDEHRIPMNLLICWHPDCDGPIAIITDLNDAVTVTARYQQRPWIETLNRDVKSSGFDLEKGKMTDSTRLKNLLIPIAFAYILLVIQGYTEELETPPPQLTKGRTDGLFPPPPPTPPRTHSLFTQARNRITDLLERTSLSIVCQFFDQFFDFLNTLLSRQNEDTPQKLFSNYATQKRLLLKGSHSSVRY